MFNMITATTEELHAAGLISDEGCMSDIPLELIPRTLLKLKRDEVIDAYCKLRNCTPEELDKYERGIDTWIGFGSVTCFELGGGTLVGYGFNEIQMIVM